MALTAFILATVLDGRGGQPIEQGKVLVEGQLAPVVAPWLRRG